MNLEWDTAKQFNENAEVMMKWEQSVNVKLDNTIIERAPDYKNHGVKINYNRKQKRDKIIFLY